MLQETNQPLLADRVEEACARAASGQATAVPPRSVMKSRRFV
jgi:hypothetical protein